MLALARGRRRHRVFVLTRRALQRRRPRSGVRGGGGPWGASGSMIVPVAGGKGSAVLMASASGLSEEVLVKPREGAGRVCRDSPRLILTAIYLQYFARWPTSPQLKHFPDFTSRTPLVFSGHSLRFEAVAGRDPSILRIHANQHRILPHPVPNFSTYKAGGARVIGSPREFHDKPRAFEDVIIQASDGVLGISGIL